MFKSSLSKRLLFLTLLVLFAAWIALPPLVKLPSFSFHLFGKKISSDLPIRLGLDLQGGVQVVLKADMANINPVDREDALTSAQEIIRRRVDLYGVSEPVIQTSRVGEDYRLIVELPGVKDPQEALDLVGKTAQLDFKMMTPSDDKIDPSKQVFIINDQKFQSSGLTGQDLKKAQVQFDPNTNEPVIGLQFNDNGTKMFGQITTASVGQPLGIFIDDVNIMSPVVSTPILNGQAIVTGTFTLDQAKQLAIQLNAGALPAPIQVLEQRTIGASLGESSIRESVFAGLVGLGLVALFMILNYGLHGTVATLALVVYAVLTVALYKIMEVTLTLPGIAGLLLSIGMAVDANILIFERFKEEFRAGHSYRNALELGFGRAWESIKDANFTTILTALVLINPLNVDFLNRSGLVRGFGVTLLIGVLLSLFTGVVVSRNLLRVFAPWIGKLYERKKKS